MFTQQTIHDAVAMLFKARRDAGLEDADILPPRLAEAFFLGAAIFCDVPFDDTDYFRGHIMRVYYHTVRLVPKNIDAHISAIHHDTGEDRHDFCTKYVQIVPVLGFRFGDNVEQTIGGLTNPKISKKLPPEERAKRYQENVIEKIEDPRVEPVKCSDFFVNGGNVARAPVEKRLKLARKYCPLYPIFIRVARKYGDYGRYMSAELEKAEADAKAIIAAA